jgi:hypothetical protein
MEFAIVDNGFKVHDGRVLYEWLHLADGAGRRFFRAVAFRELTYLPTHAAARDLLPMKRSSDA